MQVYILIMMITMRTIIYRFGGGRSATFTQIHDLTFTSRACSIYLEHNQAYTLFLQFLSGGMRNGQSVNLWQNKTTMTFFKQSRTSTYTFAVTTTMPPRPVQYMMMGFDSLLGSHFDEYIIDYDFYDEATAISDDIFSIPKSESVIEKKN